MEDKKIVDAKQERVDLHLSDPPAVGASTAQRANGSNGHGNKSAAKIQHDLLLSEALRLAGLGVYVVPLHEPLFDDKQNCIGCTCEAYKRSDDYRKLLEKDGRGKRFNPNYTCKNQGKHPRIGLDWETKASNDAKQIRDWWKRWPTANLGIAAGKSGQILLDQDKYKEAYENTNNILTSAERQTPTVLSGRGGENLVYALPTGATYGNATGDLPAGVDIRGCGGMYVVYPSIHWCGEPYQWEDGYALGEIDLLPLPDKVETLLKTASGNNRADGAFSSEAVERSTLRVEKILKEKEIEHKGREDYGKGKRWVLTTCVFNPDEDPHEDDDDAPFIIVHPDGHIAAGCQHNRCKHRIANEGKFEIEYEGQKIVITSGWRLLKRLLGYGEKATGDPEQKPQTTTTDGRPVNPSTGEIFEYGHGENRELSTVNAEQILNRFKDIAANDALDDYAKREEVNVMAGVIGRLTGTERLRVKDGLINILSWKKGDASTFVAEAGKDARAAAKEMEETPDLAIDKDEYPTWPYAVHDGQIVFLQVRATPNGETKITATPIADFSAQIYEQSIVEDGDKILKIQGEAIRGGEFKTELVAKKFSDNQELKATLEVAAGPKDPVRAGMEKHLGPAIKLFTKDEIVTKYRYHRTGWVDGKFLIPGREEENTEIIIPRKLPYGMSATASLTDGLDAFENLILSMTPTQGTIILATILQAPLALAANWRDERYALFVKGRTGTLKTSNLQTAMCIYGPRFQHDDMLIKWGEGATRNAMMAMAANACDVPILFDNYKPSTGGGAHDFTNLMHNILEGGEKDRLDRASHLRENRPVFSWPICTGEDVPGNDTAALARVIVIKSNWQIGRAYLSLAQSKSNHLSAVGAAWIDWIESDDGKEKIKEIASKMEEYRNHWAGYIEAQAPHMVNILRVATNLATNQLTWEIACEHPTIGPIVAKYEKHHNTGLENVAQDMSDYTAAAIEWQRFLQALREMLSSGKAILIQHKKHVVPDSSRDRIIGWKAKGGGVYLYPEVARKLVESLVGKEVLGSISNNTLYDQLDAAGMIETKAKGRLTILKRLGENAVARVLHLKQGAITDLPKKDNTIDDEDADLPTPPDDEPPPNFYNDK